jgi:chromosome partitioning protein
MHNLDVLPGSRNIAEVDVLLRSRPEEAEKILRQIRETAGAYDFVLFDCPPSLGHLTQLALFASAEVLIPMQCEYYAMEGLTHMGAMVKKVAAQKPEDLAFAGILLTMYDAGWELTHEVDREVRNYFGENVFDIVIPRDAAVSEAQAHGMPVMDYSPRSRAARAYIELCMDILDRRTVI